MEKTKHEVCTVVLMHIFRSYDLTGTPGCLTIPLNPQVFYINSSEGNDFKAVTSKIKVYEFFLILNPYEQIILNHRPTQILTV